MSNIAQIIEELEFEMGLLRKQEATETTNHLLYVYQASISALKKQLVIPPKKERTPVGDYRCADCNAAFIWLRENETKYCGNCGQKLFEEENDNERTG